MVVVVLVVLTSSLYPAGAEEGGGIADGKALYEERCTPCHSTKRIERMKKSRERWKNTVMRMREKDPHRIGIEEAETIVDYLAENFGTSN